MPNPDTQSRAWVQGRSSWLALLLLVLGILADHHDLALAADDLALLADGLHGRTNLHALLPPVVESERGCGRGALLVRAPGF